MSKWGIRMAQQVQGTTLHDTENIRLIRQALTAQQEDLQLLCTYAEYCIGVQHVGIDDDEVVAFKENVAKIEARQQKRYDEIDTLLHDTFRDLRKEKTTDDRIYRCAKDARQTEAGLRTLRLFLTDIIDMLSNRTLKRNRAVDRLGYFEKRSADVEAQIMLVQEKATMLANR